MTVPQAAPSTYGVVPCSPHLIPRLEQPKQHVLWIGCSDSGFEETTVLDLSLDETIVLRDIANMAVQSELACASMVQYAVEILKVTDIVVCGHYGCGIVKASSSSSPSPSSSPSQSHNSSKFPEGPWFSKLESLRSAYRRELDLLPENERDNHFVELNVLEQMKAVQKFPEVARAVQERGVKIHGLVYSLSENKSVRLITL